MKMFSFVQVFDPQKPEHLFADRSHWASLLCLLHLIKTISIILKMDAICCNNQQLKHVCIMKTIFGLDTSEKNAAPSYFRYKSIGGCFHQKGLGVDE